MNFKSFKTVLAFAICLIVNVTVCAQPSTLCDGCVIYTRNQDIRCLECLVNMPLKDSIISKKDSIIEIQSVFIDASDKRILDLGEQIIKLERKKKRNQFIFLGVGAAGGGFLGWLVGKNIK